MTIEEPWVAMGDDGSVMVGDDMALLGPHPLVVGANACYMGFGAATGAATSQHWIYDLSYRNAFQRIEWTDFLSSSALVGSSVMIDGALRLTPASSNQSGNAWLQEPIRIAGVGGLLSWDIYFSCSMGGGTRADGLSLILQAQSTGVGGIGGGLGYAGIADSVAVGYDIYSNPWDPNNNHVEINAAGAANPSLQTANPAFQMWTSAAPGARFHNWLVYDGAAQSLAVYISQVASRPDTPLMTRVIDLAPHVLPAAPS
jgi:hypothetical protein